jgi:mannan endo-1,4-beta-mannosidase
VPPEASANLQAKLALGSAGMPWIATRPGLPYFLDESGETWTPIGANEAITWPELAPLFRRRDLAAVERHLHQLRDQGVTCLRLMLEYCHFEHRYLERPVGRFVPNMVRLWDDLFALLESTGLRVLLTPYDTFFMWTRWRHHPYNRRNGGPCSSRRRWLTCPQTREAIKARLAFASDRWGGSPALFAWDLWNEIHPAHGGDDPETIAPFVADLSGWLRKRETQRYGRAHPQTVSIFGPQLTAQPATVEPIFRHPSLDFASTHLYEFGTIDDPRDTVAPAIATGRLMRAAVNEARDLRPVLDSEHGPIHRFKDKRVTLPEPFDDEYFRHIQWAHLASGGAGGGMRWPNRHPHVLTQGMRRAQGVLAQFLPLIDWTSFRRRNISEEVACSDPQVQVFACADDRQAVLWLLSKSPIGTDRRLAPRAPRPVDLHVPGLSAGTYTIQPFDTVTGELSPPFQVRSDGKELPVTLELAGDLAVAVQRREGPGNGAPQASLP